MATEKDIMGLLAVLDDGQPLPTPRIRWGRVAVVGILCAVLIPAVVWAVWRVGLMPLLWGALGGILFSLLRR